MQICARGVQRLMGSVFLSHPVPYFGGQRLSMTLETLTNPATLVYQSAPENLMVPPPQHTAMTSYMGSDPRARSKHFPDRTTVPASISL